jgi:hypothetical protein
MDAEIKDSWRYKFSLESAKLQNPPLLLNYKS